MAVGRILANPVRLTGLLHPEQVASMIAVDAAIRRRIEVGAQGPAWELSTVSGDVAVSRAVQRAIAREGVDASELGREGFAARARALEAQAEADLRRLIDLLHLSADLDRWGRSSDEASRAARIAFVRLYEAGVLQRTEAILHACPSCETVVDDADADDVELDVDQVQLQLPLVDGELHLELTEPELLVGAVAVAVPASMSIVDRSVELPLVETEVPVVVIEGIERPVLVVPGHDPWAFDLVRRIDYPVVEVLDRNGVVRVPGPLEGLTRYAARAAALEQLTAEGVIVAWTQVKQRAKRCYRCGTVLLPMLGRHWILDMAALTGAVAEAMEAGALEFTPSSAADDFRRVLGDAGSWVISQQLWSGHPIPVATCFDCGQTKVSVEEESSCNSCMGTLKPHPDVLDGRFIAAVTPLAMMGWPQAVDSEDDAVTFSVGSSGLEAWVLPMAVLGLRLAGRLPFSQVVVHAPGSDADSAPVPLPDYIEAAESMGPARMRATVLAGGVSEAEADALVQTLKEPVAGHADFSRKRLDFDAALDRLDAGGALRIVRDLAVGGVDDACREELEAMVRPLLAT